MSTGFVYFIANDAAVKIGFSADPAGRLRDLQTASPYSLQLLGAVEGGKKHERAIHAALDEFRLRGEWFRLCPEVTGFVERAIKFGMSGGIMDDLTVPKADRVRGVLGRFKVQAKAMQAEAYLYGRRDVQQ